jgi:meckelin
MNCTEKLSSELESECGGETREDGIKCMQTEIEPYSQRNFFGNFFTSLQRLKENSNYDFMITDIDTYRNKLNGYNCENERLILCQQLINACILNQWRENNNPYCTYINELNKDDINKVFDQTKPNDNTVTVSYTLEEENNSDNRRLNFWVSKFGANGTLLKFERLEYEFLQCDNSNHGRTKFKYYGNNFESECHININKYLDQETNFFYEIFLENNREGEAINLIPIPIKITNINNRQVYRMFLHYYDKNNNKFTYASKVKLYVETLSPKEEYKIKYPYFEVTYDEFSDTRDTSKNYIKYTFISEYKSNIEKFVKAMVTVFWVLTGLVIFLVLYRTFVWISTNPRSVMPSNYLLKLLFELIYKSCKYLGTFYFWFTFGISAYWYFFYKLPDKIYYLIPPTNEEAYQKFKMIFYIGFGCYMLKMFIRIYKQVSFDIFFVDWETEKVMAVNDIKSSLDKYNSIKSKKYRSAWRMIHVANQFNQLQKERTFHLYFGFCWIVLLYFRCNWYRREHTVPRDDRLNEAPINFILRNFIASIILLASVSIELVVVKILQIWLPLKKQEFMDLCSVSNISVFILDDYLHGYYIHGLSPFLKADVNYDELFGYLNQEGTGSVRSRGLENDNIEEHNKNQSYEMYLSQVMRTIYDGLYIIQTESMMIKGVNAQNYFKKSKLGRRLFRNFLNFEKEQTLLDNYMNNQLKSKLELVSSNVMMYIKDKTFCQRIMGYTINDSGMQQINAPDLLFYRDYGQNFDDLLFCGMEWEWFIMDLFIFQLFMMVLDDDFISMLITFLIDNILYYIRSYLGDSNVAKKAVVDDRFLN